MSQQTVKIKLPAKIAGLFAKPLGDVRYRCAYGGRGSGKSFGFAMMAAVFGLKSRLRVLCTREFQASIRESFHAELRNAIASNEFLTAHYDVGVDFIRGKNGTEFIFRGLHHNIGSIKSMAQVDICIIEEAEDIPEQSWIELLPTIRRHRSEIWVIWNPRKRSSPVDTRFVQTRPPRCVTAMVNYSDNPWFPDVLNEQRSHDLRTMSYEQYAHIWEGAYWTESDAQVLRGKIAVREFTSDENIWDGPYFGADWGFSVDPTVLIKLWIFDKTLYVEHEAWGVGVEIDQTPALFDQIAGSRQHVIRADSARPETISYMRRQGFNIRPAIKGKGSVEDGVTHLRGYEQIVIHPRCQHSLEESRLWSYKRDRLTGDVLPILIDAHNHCWDAARYALEPIMKRGSGGYDITTGQNNSIGVW